MFFRLDCAPPESPPIETVVVRPFVFLRLHWMDGWMAWPATYVLLLVMPLGVYSRYSCRPTGMQQIGTKKNIYSRNRFNAIYHSSPRAFRLHNKAFKCPISIPAASPDDMWTTTTTGEPSSRESCIQQFKRHGGWIDTKSSKEEEEEEVAGWLAGSPDETA